MTELLEIFNQIPRTTPADVNFEKKFDLVVVGCGTSGSVALLTAAKRGLSVLGIERMSVPGGTMTEAGITEYYFGSPGGIYEEIDGASERLTSEVYSDAAIHADGQKLNLGLLFDRYQIPVLYDSVLCGVYRDGRRLTGVQIFSCGKLRNIGASALIDATGEGSLISLAGCETSYGRESDGTCVPFTLSELDLIPSQNRTVLFNPDSGKLDCRDCKTFSQAILYGQSEYARHIPGLIKLRLQSMPGIREGRLLCGEKVLRADEFLSGKLCDKPVFYAYADLDKHGGDLAFDSKIFRKWHILANLGAVNLSVPVPMGVLIAKEYDNLAVAGRCLSVDHEMQTCVRMNRDMRKAAEVSATLVSLALSHDIPLREVDYEELAEILRSTGCLDEKNNRGAWYDGHSPDPGYVRPVKWPECTDEADEMLSSLCPGAAIWATSHGDEQMHAHLRKNLLSENENLAKHSAFSLAIREDASSEDVLLSIVQNRDRTVLKDLRKRNKCRLSMAICGLGILGSLRAIPLLKALMLDENEHTHYESAFGLRADYYSVLSYSAAALSEIAHAHPEINAEIADFLTAFFKDEVFILRFCDNDPRSTGYSLGRELQRSIALWSEQEKKTE